jgi:phospholipase D1/2
VARRLLPFALVRSLAVAEDLPRRLLEEGRNCWRIEPAERVAFLVDGERYFGAVADALERARERIFLIGWDFHTGMRLRRGNQAPDLVAFLDGLVRRRRDLRIHVLEWDFAMLFALERQILPRIRFGRRTHPRIRFALDGNHPSGGSHHQKLVVVDDAIAFTGGFDLAPCRWDTREHRPDDDRRCDPGFSGYAPFHDVGVAVDGAAAGALAELARERWRTATGETIPPARAGADPWPEALAPDLRGVAAGLSRTAPAYGDAPECREVATLWLDAIRSARRSIYVENQYLTSSSMGDALAERLREPDGPEIVLVVPKVACGWLEEQTMGVLRARLVKRLRDADRCGRLAVVYPSLPGGGFVNVHSKVLIVDDHLVRIGSANLANRSMGLDTELDVTIEACGEDRVAKTIAAFRDDLLAEHLCRDAAKVRAEHRRTGSLVATIEALAEGERTLRPVECDVAEWAEDWIPDVLDPERAVSGAELLGALLPEVPADPPRKRRFLRGAAIAAFVLGAAALWHYGPLAKLVAPEALAAIAAPLRAEPFGPIAAALGIAVAGTLLVPITALIVASGLVYGPALGSAVALAGALGSAALGYGAGRALWRDALHRVMTPRLLRLSRRVATHGFWAAVAIRIVPVAPFAAVNVAAGALRIRFRDFALGTLAGMAPGILAMTAFADHLRRLVLDPGWRAGVVLAAIAAALLALRHFVTRRVDRAAAEDELGSPARAY